MLYEQRNLRLIRFLKDDIVALIYNNALNREQVFKPISEFNNVTGILLASSFNRNTTITGFVYDDGELIGYLEEFNPVKVYNYKQNEKALFLQHCEENIFLSKFGYINFDPATINFFVTNIGFDKSAVVAINNMPKNIFDIYLILFNHSYKEIPLTYIHQIQKAMKTRDKLIIHSTYKKVYQELTKK